MKKDYDSSIQAYTAIKKNENNQLLKQVDVIKNWKLGNIYAYVESMREMNYQPNQTLYTIGDPSETVYIVKRGRIQLEIFFVVKTSVELPSNNKNYTTKKCNQVIGRVVRTIGRG